MSYKAVDVVLDRYEFPFAFRPEQIRDVNQLAALPRSGWWDEVGTGKTAMSTAVALYKKILKPKTVTIIAMPPVLITQWRHWLRSIKGVGEVLAYRGSPKERAKLKFDEAEFILVSLPIFKRDYERFCEFFTEDKPVCLIIDEATSVKNPGSGNHKAVRDFVNARNASLLLLTGTPLSTPIDAYAYIKLVTPMLYRNKRHFESLHVAERDYFDNVTKWSNLDLLSDNLMCSSSRILKKDAMPDLDEPIYIPIRYELSSQHAALYRKLAIEQFLILENGGRIDASTAPKLYNAVQQIVVNWNHFSGDPDKKSAGIELVETVLEELGSGKPGGQKLLISSNYKMTNRYLLEHLKEYNPVAFYSEVSQSKQQQNYRQFIDDPNCWVALVQPLSGGFGLDNFKDVCWDMLFLECPVIPTHFTQVVGRLYRMGQKFAPRVRIGIAEGTIQNRLHNRLLMTDELVNQVQGGWKDLKEAIYGN